MSLLTSAQRHGAVNTAVAAAVRGVRNESLRSSCGLRTGVMFSGGRRGWRRQQLRGVRNESEELGGGLEVQRDWSYGLPQKMW